MTDTVQHEARRALSVSDHYLALLAAVLLGYALMGKGFAYLGFPPLYVGEIALLMGAVVFLRAGVLVPALASLPSLALGVAMVWVMVRTIPYVGAYGVDSLRDSVIIMYGGFAFIVIGLLLEDARRINTVLRYYSILLAGFPVMAVGFWLTKYWSDYVPRLYGPGPIVDIGASAVGTHLAGAMIFILIGYRRVSPLWLAVWFGTLAMIVATNRGAALAVLVPVMLAVLLLGRLRLLFTTLAVGSAVFASLLVYESNFTPHNEAKDSMDRPVSAHQILENAKSIFGQSGQQTEGTKRWRLNWWEIIIHDTIYGPNFWTGRGFGINLADADGFGGTADPQNPLPPLRSPHNAHMTLLARAGVPGVALWILVLVSWHVMLVKAMLSARARADKEWADLFLFILCYAAAFLINATFDVTLEGPMQGIWFWCLFGFGVGSVMIYRAQVVHGLGAPSR